MFDYTPGLALNNRYGHGHRCVVQARLTLSDWMGCALHNKFIEHTRSRTKKARASERLREASSTTCCSPNFPPVFVPDRPCLHHYTTTPQPQEKLFQLFGCRSGCVCANTLCDPKQTPGRSHRAEEPYVHRFELPRAAREGKFSVFFFSSMLGAKLCGRRTR